MIFRPVQCAMLIKPYWLIVIMSASVFGSPAVDYDSNNDKRLKSPTTQQINKAMEYGEKFQASMIPRPAAVNPPVAIPESYLESPDVYPALPPDDPLILRPWLYWGYSPCGPYNDFERFVFNTSRFRQRSMDNWFGWSDFFWAPCRGLRRPVYTPHFSGRGSQYPDNPQRPPNVQ